MKIFGNPDNFRGLNDPEVKKNENDDRIINNYTIAMYRLGEAFLEKGHRDSALHVGELVLEMQAADNRWQTKSYILRLFAKAGDFEKIRYEAKDEPEGDRIYLSAAQDLIKNQNYDAALELLKYAYEDFPGSYSVLNNLAVLYAGTGEKEKADSLILDFSIRNSGQPDLGSSLNQLNERLRNVPELPQGDK
jgi:tetratricopeptide (TPR) repeat protein